MTPVRATGQSRVPDVNAPFWIIKLITTGVGEAASDFLVRTFAPEAVVPVMLLVLVAALLVQFRMRGYVPFVYWSTALAVAVFGTMAADVLHVGLGVPYVVSTAGFALILAAVFVAWRLVEGTLSVHSITTPRRERFYWAAVLSTFALGTAAGDWTATGLGIGYFASIFVFGIAFAIPGLLYALTRRGAVGLFWASYVLTRPFGASIADWLGVPPSRGGVDVGTGVVSVVGLALFVLLVGAVSLTRRRAPQAVLAR